VLFLLRVASCETPAFAPILLVPYAIPQRPGSHRESVIMADAILIACPECNKRLRTPSHLQGKKIRCKACGHTFTAKKLGSDDEDAAVKSKTKGAGSKSPHPDFEADNNPYAVVDMGMTYRCPHCAAEMESEDARICLHCGYDTQARERHETKMT